MLSMRTQEILDFSVESSINMNLLQFTVRDRAFIFDLSNNGQCIHDYADMQQLLEPEQLVPGQVAYQRCRIVDDDDDSKTLTV